jgi:hypothetical protein
MKIKLIVTKGGAVFIINSDSVFFQSNNQDLVEISPWMSAKTLQKLISSSKVRYTTMEL